MTDSGKIFLGQREKKKKTNRGTVAVVAFQPPDKIMRYRRRKGQRIKLGRIPFLSY